MNIKESPRDLPEVYLFQVVISAKGFGLVTLAGIGQVIAYFAGIGIKSWAIPVVSIAIGIVGAMYVYKRTISMKYYTHTMTTGIKQVGTIKRGHSQVLYEDEEGNVYEKRYGRSDYSKYHPDHVLYDPENPERMYLGADMLCLKIDEDGNMKR